MSKRPLINGHRMQDKGKQPHHPDSHVFIETVTPQGNPLCILGDPEMSVETRQALGIMADLVYQMALKGQL